MAHSKSGEIPSPRHSMVETAVNFLLNPQIRSFALEERKSFLKKKGLTDEEIELAIQKADEGATLPHTMQPMQSGPVVLHKRSLWSQMYRMSSSFVIIALTAYGLHQFYKLYLEPILFGYRRRTELEKLQQQIVEVHRSIADLRQAVVTMETSISLQKEEVNSCLKTLKGDQELMLNPITLNEVQAEISTIKSLLLSRHQFPNAPKIYPSIPAWQLPSKSNEEPEKLRENIENDTLENDVEVSKKNQDNDSEDATTSKENVDKKDMDDENANHVSSETSEEDISNEDMEAMDEKESSEDETISEKKNGGEKRKRTKDPNAHRRSLSAFFFFCNDERSKVKASMSNATVDNIAKELQRRWKEVSSDIRAKYEALAAKDEARYLKVNPESDSHMNISSECAGSNFNAIALQS